MKGLIILKLKMYGRMLKSFPLPALLILLAMLAGFFYGFTMICNKDPYRYWISCALILALLSFHTSRKDHRFCTMLLSRPYLLFVLEYLCITLPFAVIASVRHELIQGLLYFAIPFLIAVLPRNRSVSSQDIRPLRIKLPSLEAISFFRHYRITTVLVILSAVILSFASGLTPIIIYLFILFYAGTAYSQSENMTLLCIGELSAKRILSNKILKEILFWAKPVLTILLLYTVFNPETAYISAIPILLGPVIMATCISIKYAGFQPGKATPDTLSRAMVMLGFIIPVFLPISLIMSIIYYKRAIYNLNLYLDADYQ